MAQLRLILIFASMFVYGLLDNARGPLFPKILEGLHLSDSVGAFFFTVTSLSSLIANLLARIPIARFGLFRMLLLSQFGFFAAFLWIARSSSFFTLLFAAGLLGLAMATATLCQNTLVRYPSAPESVLRKRQIGLHAMYGLSSLLSPALVGYLLSRTWTWNSVFGVLSTAPLILAFCLLALGNRHSSTVEPEPIQSGPIASIRWAIPSSAFLLALVCALYVTSEVLISTRLVLLFDRMDGYGFKSGTLALSVFFIALSVGRVLGGLVNLRFTSLQILWFCGLSTLALQFLGLLWNPYCLALCGLSMAIFFPTALSLILERYADIAVNVVSWIFVLVSTGLITMHMGVGALTQTIGIHGAFWGSPLSLIAALGVLYYWARIHGGNHTPKIAQLKTATDS